MTVRDTPGRPYRETRLNVYRVTYTVPDMAHTSGSVLVDGRTQMSAMQKAFAEIRSETANMEVTLHSKLVAKRCTVSEYEHGQQTDSSEDAA